MSLGADTVRQFHADGYCRVEHAFDAPVALACREHIWRCLEDIGVERSALATWTLPVVRLGYFSSRPFLDAANTPRLHSAFDALVGPGAWRPCTAVGDVVVRFPSTQPPGDIGWHVDASFGHDAPDFMQWRVNHRSKGRALLMLLLFSDTGLDDAPTRLLAGSHRRVARLLEPHGEEGLALRDIVPHVPGMLGLPEVLATGAAGTAYLCHPFLVHSAQAHRGRIPRLMAQPALLPAEAQPGQADPNQVPRASASPSVDPHPTQAA